MKSWFNKKSVLETIVMLLVFLFLYTALSKYVEHRIFVAVLRRTILLKRWAGLISIVLPTVEVLLTVLLIIPRTRLAGLYASWGLLVVFTGYLLYMIRFAPNLPCTCGGVISKMTWKQHIFFNLGFIILSSIGIYLQRRINTSNKNNDNSQKTFSFA